MKKTYVILFFILVVLVVVVTSSVPFRFYPSHMIVKQSNCFSCHTDELNNLNAGVHIPKMNNSQNRFLYDYIDLYGNGNVATTYDNYRTLDGSCYSCHITYQRYNMFGLTDPYTFNSSYSNNGNNSSKIVDAQYGYIIEWKGKEAETYFNGVANIAVELEVLDVNPANFSVEDTIKVIFSNYSGQQTGNTSCDCSAILYKGETNVVVVNNVAHDYFRVVLILDGLWNNTLLNLRVNGTDQGTESFIIYVDNKPAVYNMPVDISNKSYFKTSGAYKAVRLDRIWRDWRNDTVNGNITSSELIKTNSTNSTWVNGYTCSAPDGMCHINQKVTYMGLMDGINPDRSLYAHEMEYVTSKQCKICHLK